MALIPQQLKRLTQNSINKPLAEGGSGIGPGIFRKKKMALVDAKLSGIISTAICKTGFSYVTEIMVSTVKGFCVSGSATVAAPSTIPFSSIF
jgi:hypothetical protein